MKMVSWKEQSDIFFLNLGETDGPEKVKTTKKEEE